MGRGTPRRAAGGAENRSPPHSERGGEARHPPVRSLFRHRLEVRGRVRIPPVAPRRAARPGARREGGEALMKPMNMIEAINSAHDVMMECDPDTVVMGEDVGYFGGVFRATAGLQKKYGKARVFATHIAEGGLVDTALCLRTPRCEQGRGGKKQVIP